MVWKDRGPNLLWNRIDNTQKVHVSDPLMGWGTTNRNRLKKKKKTIIHHNTIHPWFIIQAQVSEIQHAGEPPGSCQGRVKTYLKILFFGYAINDNTMITSGFTQNTGKCVKVKSAYVAYSEFLRWYLYCPEAVGTAHPVKKTNAKNHFQIPFDPDLVSVLTSVQMRRSNFQKLTLRFVHQSSLSSVSGLHGKWEEMRMPVGESGRSST